MNEKILFVDDEPNILSAFRRNLHRDFKLLTANSAREGLEILKNDESIAVVVSDQNMPEMDGITFLTKVRETKPDIVRVMLTGQAGLETAMNAVNEGNIFRFLTKPCPFDTLRIALVACLDQYHLVMSERELLEKTLKGSVQILSELLSIVNPVAFSLSLRLKKYVRAMAEELRLSPVWQYELAALLSQIGMVSLPPDLIKKIFAGNDLSSKEEEQYSNYPKVGSDLIGKIPRLEIVSEIIENINHAKKIDKDSWEDINPVVLGTNLLKVAIAFDRMLLKYKSIKEAIKELEYKPDEYNPVLVNALKKLRFLPKGKKITVNIEDMKERMILEEHIYARNGNLIATKGQEVTSIMLKRLVAFKSSIGIREPIDVYILE